MTKIYCFSAAALLGLILAGSPAQAASEPSTKTAQGPYGFSNGYSGYGQFYGGSPCRSGRCGLQSYGMPSYGNYGSFDGSYGYPSSNQYLGLGSTYSVPSYGMPSNGGYGSYNNQFGPSNFQNQYGPNQYSPSQVPPTPYMPSQSNQFGPSMNSGYSNQSFSQPYSGFGLPGSSYTQPMAGYGQPYGGFQQVQPGYGVSQPGFGQPVNGFNQPASSPFYP